MKTLIFTLFWLPLICISPASWAQHPLLVDVEWLTENLTNPKLVILDARSEQAYQRGHVLAAINLPVESTFGRDDRHHLVASLSTLKRLLSQAGIRPQDHIVIYDEGTLIDAARLFWVLETYGHKRVSVLNGGFAHWQQTQLPVEAEITRRSYHEYTPTINPDRLATKLTTRLAVENPNIILVDARSSEEYLGKKSAAKRRGHIPRAISLPWDVNFEQRNGVKHIKPLGELREIYTHIGPQKKVIAYCNRGKQSALTYFVLRTLGYNVSAYDGSWLEWGNDENLPITTPEKLK